MYKRIFLLCVLILFLLVGGCANQGLPKGLKCNVDNLPAWEKFSDTNYESYAHCFSGVKAVIYKHDGTEEIIAHDDPRVTRLLNFLAYSDEKGLSSWRQGYVRQEEVDRYLATDEPVVEIIFQNNKISETKSIAKLQKILICGDSYLRFTDINDELCVERCWPYGELIMRKITEGNGYEGLISYDGWGANYWIDFLAYAGFDEK